MGRYRKGIQLHKAWHTKTLNITKKRSVLAKGTERSALFGFISLLGFLFGEHAAAVVLSIQTVLL